MLLRELLNSSDEKSLRLFVNTLKLHVYDLHIIFDIGVK